MQLYFHAMKITYAKYIAGILLVKMYITFFIVTVADFNF